MHKKDNRARYICLIIASHYLKKRIDYATPSQSLIKALHSPIHIAQLIDRRKGTISYSNNRNTLYEMIRTFLEKSIGTFFMGKSSETF